MFDTKSFCHSEPGLLFLFIETKSLISLDDICNKKCHLIDVQFVVYAAEERLQDHAEDLYFQ